MKAKIYTLKSTQGGQWGLSAEDIAIFFFDVKMDSAGQAVLNTTDLVKPGAVCYWSVFGRTIACAGNGAVNGYSFGTNAIAASNGSIVIDTQITTASTAATGTGITTGTGVVSGEAVTSTGYSTAPNIKVMLIIDKGDLL